LAARIVLQRQLHRLVVRHRAANAGITSLLSFHSR
jgi:hypothetical protein